MPISQRVTGSRPERICTRARHTLRASVLAGTIVLATAVACKDSAVPYFDAPTGIPNSQTGVQNAVTGFFSGTRADAYLYAYNSTGYARDLFYFVSSAPPVLTIPAGLVPVAPGNFAFNDMWDDEYLTIKQANSILTSLGGVGYTPTQVAAIQGVVQTMKALEFMVLAETRDTLGIPLYSIDGDPTSPPYCNKDVWQYIVALLDSGFGDLKTAGATPLPVTLPPGFAAVSLQAAPSTASGSFASFNRALAGKAGLEYAYAYARNSAATHPTPTTAGGPLVSALQRADSALTASALYNPAAITPPRRPIPGRSVHRVSRLQRSVGRRPEPNLCGVFQLQHDVGSPEPSTRSTTSGGSTSLRPTPTRCRSPSTPVSRAPRTTFPTGRSPRRFPLSGRRSWPWWRRRSNSGWEISAKPLAS